MGFYINSVADSNLVFDSDFSPKNAIFTNSSSLTTTETKFVPSTASRGGNFFGFSVAVGSGRIVVSADGDNSGAAYIFDLDGTQLAKITASDGNVGDRFGYSVAVGSGRIVVGAFMDDFNSSNTGSIYIFDLNGNQISNAINQGLDGDSMDQFGYSVAVGSNRIVVGVRNDDDNGTDSGAAYIFDLDGNQLTKIKASDGAASDQFGWSVAVGSGRIVVGAYGDDDNGSASGSAYIFDLDGTQLAKIKPSDGATDNQFGWSVAVGSGRIVVGADGDDDNGSGSGSAYIFDLDGTQLAKIDASDGAAADFFGTSVAVGSSRIVVGAYGDGGRVGAAYIYDLDGTQLAKIVASDNVIPQGSFWYGFSVAAGPGRIVVGSPVDDGDGSFAGSAHLYKTGPGKDIDYSEYIEDVLGGVITQHTRL